MRTFSDSELVSHFGFKCRTLDGVITEWLDERPQPDWDALDLELVTIRRHAAIDAEVQTRKNASLGKTPEQIAETLKTQVNMGIGGLLLMLQRLQAATGTTLASKGVCTEVEFAEALQAALGPEANAIITQRLAYWNWIVAIDAHAADLKAAPELIPNYPAAPTL